MNNKIKFFFNRQIHNKALKILYNLKMKTLKSNTFFIINRMHRKLKNQIYLNLQNWSFKFAAIEVKQCRKKQHYKLEFNTDEFIRNLTISMFNKYKLEAYKTEHF